MFSQRDEEKYIIEFFKNTLTGKFLDIGAYDGITFSTTRRLVLNGWEGVMIEPSPTVFPKLEELYKENKLVKCIQVAVSDISGKREFYDAGGDAVSSFDTDHVKLWKEKAGVPFKKVDVDSLCIEDFFNVVGHDFEFLNIDTEGYSMFILKNLPYDKLKKMKMICVEFDHKSEEMLGIVKPFGFTLLHRTAENLILVRS